jgi:prevent-host-death family protein
VQPVGDRQASVGIPEERLYDLYKGWGSMGEIAVSQARENLAEVIETTQRSGEPIVLTRHGRPVAVVLEHGAFERLVAAADEASDRAALALAREDDDSVPWEQVKVDLGLV